MTSATSAATSAAASPARLAEAAPDAPGPAGAGARLGQFLKTMGNMVDARTAVMRGDDAEFMQEFKGRADPERGVLPAGSTLPELRNAAQALRTQLLAQDVPAELQTRFEGRLAHLDSTLEALETEQPLARRAAVYLGMNTLLPVLPVAIAFRGHQNQFEAELAGLYAKTALMAIGSARSPTGANWHSAMDHFMSRHYINVVQAAIFALPTFLPQLHKLNGHPAFNVGAGMVSTAALFLGFLGKETRELTNRMRHGVPDPELAAAGTRLQQAAGFPAEPAEPAADDAGETVQAAREAAVQARTALSQALDLARADQKAVTNAKASFLAQGDGKELSPVTSKQLTLVADAFLSIATDLERILHPAGLPEQAASAANGAEQEAEKAERIAKYALAAFTGAVCATTTGLMYPDQIGMVDLASDAAFTVALMVANARNPNITRRDALDEFKSFAGLSLVMIAVLTANHAADDFIEKNTTGMLLGAAAMALLNVSIPGPVGHLAGAGLEKMYAGLQSMRPAELSQALRGIGHNAMEWLRGQFMGAAPVSVPSSVEIHEIQEPEAPRHAPVAP
ncbi:hypothetical protein M5C97_24685 [Acidovorax sp. NCPPB 3859]|nr:MULTISPECIES: hypothetical protein [unclassified Acidovorax]MDA8450349.1 hypothetical protein [Acidovorax sp. GBBC 3297]MDA8459794.1 hypothetical protein [Acidovorax sp. GBBC 3333]MDA8464830.1 hypothetical protein [Acidovorax sp. GBBC 3332]MDA8469711.1 hypothetical protein [Acidovorax sp. GBBC 3299]WCM78638.1 hypothetical protein M5C94_24635 [Acidovorax sp. GBBC 712]